MKLYALLQDEIVADAYIDAIRRCTALGLADSAYCYGRMSARHVLDTAALEGDWQMFDDERMIERLRRRFAARFD